MGEDLDFLAALERIRFPESDFQNQISIMMELEENMEYNSSLKGFIYLRQFKIVHNQFNSDWHISIPDMCLRFGYRPICLADIQVSLWVLGYLIFFNAEIGTMSRF